MSQRPSPMCFVLVVSSPLVGWSWKMASWGLCPALDVFVSVWFGVPTVLLVVAQPGPAASLTDDLQLARLARAAAVATGVVLLAVATGQAHCWGWEGVALAQSRSGGHSVNTQCSAVSLPASRQDCLSAPSIPIDKFTDIP